MNNTTELIIDLFEDKVCNRDNSYIAGIITIIPPWLILTTLIILVIFSFHKGLRSTKIYDNCNKINAQYTYLVELRTGDTSSTYNRRRTTLTVDMFDDNQNTLARVAVPGHLIFGKKDSPIATIDDEKFFELRVTRFWLYRATRLKRLTTIRLTHSCLEAEARIMIYAIEIRSNEKDKYKLFFPVMSYISAYGVTNKPNASFDVEPSGSISNIGGSQIDSSTITDHLSLTDYAILLYVLSSLIFILATLDMPAGSTSEYTPSIYRGIIIGVISIIVTFFIGVMLRYVIRAYYSLTIGTGIWAFVYYSTSGLLLLGSSVCWIYAIYFSFKSICPDYYNYWFISLFVAILFIIITTVIVLLVIWSWQVLNSKQAEQYIIPDDYNGLPQKSDEPPSRGRAHLLQQQQQQQQQQQNPYMPSNYPTSRYPNQASMKYPNSWQQGPPVQPLPGGYGIYGQPMTVNTIYGTYKTIQDYPIGYEQQPQAGVRGQPPVASPNYHQQTVMNRTALSPVMTTPQDKAGIKKIGSNESTGSSYYQQLMKNKGGVKSISQYGELLKQQKKAKQQQQQPQGK